jgi:hypothetical protein
MACAATGVTIVGSDTALTGLPMKAHVPTVGDMPPL